MGIKENDKEYIINTYNRQNVAIVKGHGSTCYDENGKVYIDLGSGIGVNSLGYSNPKWVMAVAEQANTLQHASNLYYTKPCSDLAKLLCEKTAYSKAFFCNSGAEANEGAIKIARKYSFDKYGKEKKRNKIITLVNSFHGRTVTTLSATGQDVFHNYFFPFNEGFDYALANDIEDLKNKLDDTVCAVMFEFIQGEGGVIPLDKDYVKELFSICGERDILTIADEVQTGIGRTGKLLTSEHFGVKPDITTLAKGLGGGLPIGAVLTNEKTKSVLGFSDHGTTFGGNPVVCAGAIAVLEEVANEGFLNEVLKKGEYIRQELSEVSEVAGIDGIGMMLGVSLKTKKAGELLPKCIENGVIPLTAKAKIRLLPPLNISFSELKKGIDILKKTISED